MSQPDANEVIDLADSDADDVQDPSPAAAPRAKRAKKDETFEMGLCTTSSKEPTDPMCMQQHFTNGVPTSAWMEEYGRKPPPFVQRLIDTGAMSNLFDVFVCQWEVGKEGTLHAQWGYKLKMGVSGKTRLRFSVQTMIAKLRDGLMLCTTEDYSTDTHFPNTNTHFACGTKSLENKACSPSFKAVYNYCSYDKYPMHYHNVELRGTQKRVPGTDVYIYNPSGLVLAEEKGTTAIILSRLAAGHNELDIISDMPLGLVRCYDNVVDKYKKALPTIFQKCGNQYCNNRRFCKDLDTYGPAILQRYKQQFKCLDTELTLQSPELIDYVADIGRECRYNNIYLFGDAETGKTTDAVDLALCASLEDHGTKEKMFSVDSRKGFFGTLSNSPEGCSAIVWNEISLDMFDGNVEVFKNNFECKANFMNTKNGDARNVARLNVVTSNPCPIELLEKFNKGSSVQEAEYKAYLRRFNMFYKFTKPTTNDIAALRLYSPNAPEPHAIVRKATPPTYESYCKSFTERSISTIGNPLAMRTPYIWTLSTDISSSEWAKYMQHARMKLAGSL